MKKVYGFVVLLFGSLQFLNGQDPCSLQDQTYSRPPYVPCENDCIPANYSEPYSGKLRIPVIFHMINNVNRESPLDEMQIQPKLDITNQIFDDQGLPFYFYQIPSSPNEIISDDLYDFKDGSPGCPYYDDNDWGEAESHENFVDNVINIFICNLSNLQNLVTTEGPNGEIITECELRNGILGVTDTPNDIIDAIFLHYDVFDANENNKILAHELGHFLGL